MKFKEPEVKRASNAAEVGSPVLQTVHREQDNRPGAEFKEQRIEERIKETQIEASRNLLRHFQENYEGEGRRPRIGVVFGESNLKMNERRVSKALELFKSSKIDFLIVLGTEDEVKKLRSALVRGGIPNKVIASVGHAIDTHDNIRSAIKVLKNNDVSEFSLINSQFQGWRASLIFAKQMRALGAQFKIDYQSVNDWDLVGPVRLAGEGIELAVTAVFRPMPDTGLYDRLKVSDVGKSIKWLEDATYRSGYKIRNLFRRDGEGK